LHAHYAGDAFHSGALEVPLGDPNQWSAFLAGQFLEPAADRVVCVERQVNEPLIEILDDQRVCFREMTCVATCKPGAPGLRQLQCDLCSRIACSYDQDIPLLELSGIVVLVRMELCDRRVKFEGKGRYLRVLEGACCHHDVVGFES